MFFIPDSPANKSKMYLEIQLFEKPGTGWNRIAACHSFHSLPLFEASDAGIFCRYYGWGPGAWWRWTSRNLAGRPKVDRERWDITHRRCEEKVLSLPKAYPGVLRRERESDHDQIRWQASRTVGRLAKSLSVEPAELLKLPTKAKRAKS